jgi:hypothetical protein
MKGEVQIFKWGGQLPHNKVGLAMDIKCSPPIDRVVIMITI